ncbi:MAG: potassium transporter, partial [Bacteroidetes bacterium]|nr:potassium transporter [Bacteroidota bacterium]
LGVDVLAGLGYRRYTALRQGQKFLHYDEKAMAGMAAMRHDTKQYIVQARENFRLQEELLSRDLHQDLAGNDHSWDSETIRESLSGQPKE